VVPDADVREGVLLAQGGDMRGYALYLKAGHPVFGVREKGMLAKVTAPTAVTGRFSLEARLEKDGTMTLAVDGKIVARGKGTGLISLQPKDDLSIGEDTLSAVGDYASPNPFRGKVTSVHVETGK
jgi:hypothetical protein